MSYLKRQLDKIKSSSMIKNMARISGGTIFGQLISIITLPICTRLYGDKIIGEWTFLTIISTIAAAFADIGLQQSIMIEKEEHLKQTLRTVITIVSFTSIVTAVVSYVYFGVINVESVSLPTFFVIPFIFIATYTVKSIQVYSFIHNRQGNFKVLMKNPVINTTLFGVVSIAFGFIGFVEYGYYIGWLTGQIGTLLHLMHRQKPIPITLKFSDIKEVINRNKRFVMYQFPTDVLAQVKAQFPGLLIKPLFGAEILGQYSITWRVVNIPVNAIGSAIGRVFLSKTSEMRREGKDIGAFTYKSIILSMRLAILPIILIISLGDIIMAIFLGDGWIMAGNMVRILAVYAFFWFVTMSLQGITVTLQKQNFSMMSATSQIIGIATGLFIGYILGNIYIGLAIWTVSFVAISIVYICAILKVVSISRIKYLKNIGISMVIIIIGYLAIRLPLYLNNIVGTL